MVLAGFLPRIILMIISRVCCLLCEVGEIITYSSSSFQIQSDIFEHRFLFRRENCESTEPMITTILCDRIAGQLAVSFETQLAFS